MIVTWSTEARHHCQAAIARLAEAKEQPLSRSGPAVDAAERHVVQVRDALIGWSRAEPGGPPTRRAALDHANAALSEIVGVEYPVGGLQINAIDGALTSLRACLDLLR